MVMTATVNLTEVAAHWRAARRIYPIYSALVREFTLEIGSCRELESPINRSEPDVLHRVKLWFDQVDDKLHVFQLRQLLQTSHLATEDNLRALLKRYLQKPKKTEAIRDKVDYLMVQYFSYCAPQDAHNAHISIEHVADVLHPILGDVTGTAATVNIELDGLLKEMDACASLSDVLAQNIIGKVRDFKSKTGDTYFQLVELVAFARFNFLFRLGFFRLMHADLHAVRFALHSLEGRGWKSLDCSSAGLGVQEPIANLRGICHDWKKPFRAAYSAFNNFKQLVEIRSLVEKAMGEPSSKIPGVIAEEVAAVTQQAAGVVEDREKAKAAAGSLELESCLEQISSQLKGIAVGTDPVSNVLMGDVKLLLASWEVAAFVRGGDVMAEALQRAVGARAILTTAVDRKKRGEGNGMAPAIGLAHHEAAQMQERIAEAKDAKNIDAAVNLSATAKRLLALIAVAEKQI